MYLYVFITESLVWLKAPGFYYTMDAEVSLEWLLDILLLPMSWRSCSFGSIGLATSRAPTDYMWVNVVGQLITLVLGLSSCRIYQFSVSSSSLSMLVHPLQW